MNPASFSIDELLSMTPSSRADERQRSDRIADFVCRWGGSWTFIIAMNAGLLAWELGNSLLMGRSAFDPYPYVFLNLVLGEFMNTQCAFVQMSQNRTAEADRRLAAIDREIARKSAREIRAISEEIREVSAKIDRDLAGLGRRFEQSANTVDGLLRLRQHDLHDTGELRAEIARHAAEVRQVRAMCNRILAGQAASARRAGLTASKAVSGASRREVRKKGKML